LIIEQLHHNLFKLFFLASSFFLSAWALAVPMSLFCGAWAAETTAAAEETLADDSVRTPTTAWSWLVPLAPVVEGNDSGGKAAPDGMVLLSALSTEVFVWSTFRAVVDSVIAPLLNFGFGFAWIPVKSLQVAIKAPQLQADAGNVLHKN